uniref:Alanine racemase N-terminal domain-containing protein n=1 Tax=Haptolina ericina TaxID=156174 RepID=A0A7S3ATR7_9EUKA
MQTNKVKELLAVPNLHCVHTVDTAKLAAELNKRAQQLRTQPLQVMVQVNTSAEESKSGVDPAGCAALCAEIASSYPQLSLQGLMCIGKYSSAEGGADDDFACLVRCREEVASVLQRDSGSLTLSMGMSHDFETAIAAGATHVRVGSTIFGSRAPKV